MDSVAANLSEGLGRHPYKEARQISDYSRGFLFESKAWLTKAKNRNLIDETTFIKMYNTLESIGLKLNNYINIVEKNQTEPSIHSLSK